MKRVVLITLAAVFTSVFISCKNEIQKDPEVTVDTVESTNDLALVTDTDAVEATEENYMYVTAYSGLILREFNNLQSEKLARIPYGTKVRVINAESRETMDIGGIKGGMDEVAFNHKKGFAFNGYLSKYIPPELNVTPEGYAEVLIEHFPDVTFTEKTGGTSSNPTNTITLTLPKAEWHEGFFIAQRLFDFPKEFDFPNPRGKEQQSVFDSKPKKGVWTSQLDIYRTDNSLEKIEYVYVSDKYSNKVTITQEGDLMKISKTEEMK